MKRAMALMLMVAVLPAAAQDKAAATAAAKAELMDAKGRPAGSATFSQIAGRVNMKLTAHGLDGGQHGIHIHETGKCDPPDFKSAGGHFNPHGKKHGIRNDAGAHAGDLPNLAASEDGMASADMTLAGVTLERGEKHSLLDGDGSALVIHALPDDEKSDPAGNSGGRVICGVIKAAAH